MDWKKWTVIGIVAVVIIAMVVLHFVQPKVSYAYVEVMEVLFFLLGGAAGYIFKKYRIEKKK